MNKLNRSAKRARHQSDPRFKIEMSISVVSHESCSVCSVIGQPICCIDQHGKLFDAQVD